MEQLVQMVGRFFVCIYKLKSDSLQLNIIRRVLFFFILPDFFLFFFYQRNAAQVIDDNGTELLSKAILQQPIEFHPSSHPEVIREPGECLVVRSEATGKDCLAEFLTSLMRTNCSKTPSSMLMSKLVCSEASRCLLIKLILVEDAGSQAPGGQRWGRKTLHLRCL